MYTAFYYTLLHTYKIYNIVQQEITAEIIKHSTKKVIFTDEGLQVNYIHS